MTAAPRESDREWLSFEDPDEDRTWMFDTAFLASNWNCIYGAGCQGVLTGPASELAQGCCSYGAHFSDASDLGRVEAVAATLTDNEWQFARRAKRGGIAKRVGQDQMTRLVDGACIFLNRPGFSAGAGCALHLAAMGRGVEPLRFKPDVCWQLPLRREDLVHTNGHVTSLVQRWDRRHWGEAGEEFHWWCTEASEADHGAGALYRRLRSELIALVGEQIYDTLAEMLERRSTEAFAAAALANPARRARPSQ